MEKTRVLIVDDSVLMRTTISHVLSTDPELEVVGVAANGRIALAKMDQVQPDVITLDFEMPEMDGLQTLGELQKRYPTVPVIMLSSLTMSGAAETLDALARGAADYVGKPQGGDPSQALGVLGSELIPKIKIHSGRKRAKQAPPAAPPPPARAPAGAAETPDSRSANRVDAVCIGTSTGGPNALAVLFSSLPANLPVPLLIVQHMPPMFTRLLAERLTANSRVPVFEGEEGMAVEPGNAYIAPGGHHMEVRREEKRVVLHLQDGPPENSCRPAADVLFRSAAGLYGQGLLAMVLTGMGQDGMRGCESVHRHGGSILIQDEASSVVWGMPRAVFESGLACTVKPLAALGPEMVARAAMYKATPARNRERIA